MSSRIFEARTSSGDCALCARSFARGDRTFYLTCLGTGATGPSTQVERSTREDGFSTGFRTVPAGTQIVGKGNRRRAKTFWAWEQNVAGRWVRVSVWENMVHVSCASERGYRIPTGETTAERGKRTNGLAHALAPDENTPAPETPAPAPVSRPASGFARYMAESGQGTPRNPGASAILDAIPAPLPVSRQETPFIQAMREGRLLPPSVPQVDYATENARRAQAERESRRVETPAPVPSAARDEISPSWGKRFANLDLD